jgi:hypothetical protein
MTLAPAPASRQTVSTLFGTDLKNTGERTDRRLQAWQNAVPDTWDTAIIVLTVD